MPPLPFTRRRILQTAGSSLALSIAGCNTIDDDPNDRTAEPTQHRPSAATPTTTLEAPSNTETVELPALTTDDVAVDVEIREHSTDSHPARIEILIENTSDHQFELAGDYIDPFPLYSEEQSDGHPKLLLIPEERKYLRPTPDGTSLVPDEPTEGCWSVDYDILINPIRRIALPTPGTVMRQGYTILEYKNETCLPADTYRVSDPHQLTPIVIDEERRDGPTVEMEFMFELTIGEDGRVSAEVDEPSMKN